MRFEIFIPAKPSGTPARAFAAEADNWLAALKTGLLEHGDGATVPKQAVCELHADGLVRVRDPRSDDSFVVRPLAPGEAPRDVQAEAASAGPRSPSKATVAPSAPSPARPPHPPRRPAATRPPSSPRKPGAPPRRTSTGRISADQIRTAARAAASRGAQPGGTTAARVPVAPRPTAAPPRPTRPEPTRPRSEPAPPRSPSPPVPRPAAPAHQPLPSNNLYDLADDPHPSAPPVPSTRSHGASGASPSGPRPGRPQLSDGEVMSYISQLVPSLENPRLTAEQVIDGALEAAWEHVPCEFAVLTLPTRRADSMRVVSSRTSDRTSLLGFRLHIDPRLAQLIGDQHAASRAAGLNLQVHFDKVGGVVRELPVGSLLWVPVLHRGRVLAVISLWNSDRSDGFSPGEAAALDFLASSVARSLVLHL